MGKPLPVIEKEKQFQGDIRNFDRHPNVRPYVCTYKRPYLRVYVCMCALYITVSSLEHHSLLGALIFLDSSHTRQKRITDNQLELFESSNYNYYMYITKTGSKLCLKPLPGRGS